MARAAAAGAGSPGRAGAVPGPAAGAGAGNYSARPGAPVLAQQKHHHRKAFEYISKALKLDEDGKGRSGARLTRWYFNVRSKADIGQLNLPHGTDN